ncbi:TPM domain-containing protein [Rhodoligotrophos defluvii]|uniref:TPM domain-containing protein n=1 Tax=Rhodoligotrophos defluvii TaxID=2561934 RepID=UPI0010C9A7FD|nr:TPM domain-containing protein [Rhodoligotrophos defluvii]
MLAAGDIARITQAITKAEEATSGEIVAVLAHRSDDYDYIPVLWASLAALVVPFPLIFLTRLGAADIYTIALAVFLALALTFSLPGLIRYVIPRRLQELRVHRRAAEQFLARNLHTTEARTGVLLFVSLAERIAVVLADEGINAKVTQETWQSIIDRLTSEIAAGRLTDGLIAAIDDCGKVLAAHFPPTPGQLDELPNHLVVI